MIEYQILMMHQILTIVFSKIVRWWYNIVRDLEGLVRLKCFDHLVVVPMGWYGVCIVRLIGASLQSELLQV